MTTFKIIIVYLVIINLVTFIIFGYDKWISKHNAKQTKRRRRTKRRIPEKTLLSLAGAGGSVGALMGMSVWHHKTMHKKFIYGVPLILILQSIILIIVIHKYW